MRELTVSWLVVGAIHNRFVAKHISIADLEVIVAFGTVANPCLVVDGCALTAEV